MMVKLKVLSLFYFVVVFTHMDYNGSAEPQQKKSRDWPKELDSAMESYYSEPVRALIISNLAGLNESMPTPRLEAARFLLDLRNEEITFWLLTKGPATTETLDELEKRKFALRDATTLGKAMIATAFTQVEPGGEDTVIRNGRVGFLGRRFCLCLGQKYVAPKATSGYLLTKDVKEWTLQITEQALRDAGKDKRLTLELQRLRLELSEVKIQGP